ncbi:MAG: Ig-like domain-containing protein [Desulfuromonadales bacterium]|nr:Ig-like domain-containing protein [Desulfuromonadales bacterium]
MFNLLFSGLITVLLLSGCGWNGTPSRTVTDFLPLTSIEITAVSPTIAKGTSTKLTVNGFFAGLSTPVDITKQVVWTSSSTAIADFVTAASPNRVTGIAPGTATLTATVKGVSGTFTLTVSNAAVTSIAITPATVSVAQGLTAQFTAIGTFLDGTTQTTQDLTADGATWNSSAPAVATVNNTGLATAVAATGTATITATLNSVSGTAQLTATAPVALSITVTPANPSILSLSTGSFTATGLFTDGTSKDVTNQVTWTTSNSNAATIAAAGGSFTTLSQGTTTITASLNGASGTTNLNVTGGTLSSFTVSPANVTLVQGTVARLTVTGTFSNGAKRDITGFATLSPAPGTNFATVTKPGGNLALLSADNVTPVGTPTTITASVTLPSGTLSAVTSLAVTTPTISSLTISPSNMNLPAGTSARFKVIATFNDGSSQDVTANTAWSSLSTAIATVGDIGITKGRVRGVAAGNTTITAAFGGLTITPAPVVTITVRTLQSNQPVISPQSVTPGNQVQFTATANYDGGTSQDVTEDTAWSSDSTNVAIEADETNQPGQFVGVNSGSTIIKASFGGNTTTAPINIQ